MHNRTSLSFRLLAPMAVLGLAACSGGPDASSIAAPSGPLRVLTTASVGDAGDRAPQQGELEICKDGDAASFSITGLGANPVIVNLTDGQCQVVAVDKRSGLDTLRLTVTEQPSLTSTFTSVTATTLHNEYDAGVNGAGPDVLPADVVVSTTSSTVDVKINEYIGTLLEYVNTLNPPPPPPVCDFITFGRLVVEVGGKKVVISGNAGGNQPGGGTLAEFHVEANGVDNHVANVDSYGPITSGVFSGLTNSRITTGKAKNGVDVELRLWDGGEPGKGTDWVYVKLNGVEIFGAGGKAIDQGNMQYHSNCRGPKS